jgi:hypothetical protein
MFIAFRFCLVIALFSPQDQMLPGPTLNYATSCTTIYCRVLVVWCFIQIFSLLHFLSDGCNYTTRGLCTQMQDTRAHLSEHTLDMHVSSSSASLYMFPVDCAQTKRGLVHQFLQYTQHIQRTNVERRSICKFNNGESGILSMCPEFPPLFIR